MEKNKKNWFKSFAEKFLSDKALSNGLYSSVITLVLIAAVIIVNVIVAKLDIKADITTDKLFSITDETKDYIKDIKDDITIYYMTSPSKKDMQIYNLVEKYKTYGKNINIEVKDPIVYPNFVSKFDNTVTTVYDNSLLVVNNTNGKYKYLSNEVLVKTEFSYETYSYEVVGVDAEGQLTSAINMVTADKNIKSYMVKGQGEYESFGSRITSLLSKQNVEIGVVETATGEEIPEDSAGLIIYQPVVDYSEQEVEKIKNYIDSGKPLLVISGYYTEKLPVFESLLNYYGVEKVDGLVVETEAAYCLNGMAQVLNVTVDGTHAITSSLPKLYTVLRDAQAIRPVSEQSEYITITDLFTTSKKSYAVTDLELSIDKISDENSAKGPFSLGAAITKNYNDVESKIVVLGSGIAFDETSMDMSMFTNPNVIVNSINWLCDVDAASQVAIDIKENTPSMVQFAGNEVIGWTIVLIFVIPICILAAGFMVWRIRRKI